MALRSSGVLLAVVAMTAACAGAQPASPKTSPTTAAPAGDAGADERLESDRRSVKFKILLLRAEMKILEGDGLSAAMQRNGCTFYWDPDDRPKPEPSREKLDHIALEIVEVRGHIDDPVALAAFDRDVTEPFRRLRDPLGETETR